MGSAESRCKKIKTVSNQHPFFYGLHKLPREILKAILIDDWDIAELSQVRTACRAMFNLINSFNEFWFFRLKQVAPAIKPYTPKKAYVVKFSNLHEILTDKCHLDEIAIKIAKYGCIEYFKYLERSGFAEEDVYQVLWYSAYYGRLALLRYIICKYGFCEEKYNKKQKNISVLGAAILGENIPALKYLIEIQILYFKKINPHGVNALSFAVIHKKLLAIKYIISLNDPNFDINLIGHDGNAPIHHAARMGDFSIMKLIVETPGSKISLCNREGLTALQIAFIYNIRQSQIVDLLSQNRNNLFITCYDTNNVDKSSPKSLFLNWGKYTSSTDGVDDEGNILSNRLSKIGW